MNDSASKFVAKILLAAFTVSSLQLVPPSAHAAAPSSISLVATGISGEVTLTWGEPTGDPPVAYEYSIWSLGNVQVGVTGNLDASAPRSATIGGLTNGQSYSAKVSTIYAIPDSTGTLQSDSVIPYSVPNPPQKPIAERTGPGSVSISWVDESENGRAVSSYSVTCIPQCSTPISGAVSPMSISGLDTSTDYRFKVSAVNVAGPSLLSSASDPIRPSDVPGIPEIASVAAYDSSILVNWSAPATDGGSEVVEYLVTSYPESKTCKTSSATEFSCTVAGLTNGVQYTFKVKAKNVPAGYGGESLPSVSIAPSVTPPNPGVFESISIPVALKVKVKSKTKIKKIEMALGAAVPKKAKVTLTVAKASKKICKVSGGKLVALKPGNCAVTVSVQAPKPKGGKKPKAVKTSGIVAIG